MSPIVPPSSTCQPPPIGSASLRDILTEGHAPLEGFEPLPAEREKPLGITPYGRTARTFTTQKASGTKNRAQPFSHERIDMPMTVRWDTREVSTEEAR